MVDDGRWIMAGGRGRNDKYAPALFRISGVPWLILGLYGRRLGEVMGVVCVCLINEEPEPAKQSLYNQEDNQYRNNIRKKRNESSQTRSSELSRLKDRNIRRMQAVCKQ